MESIEGTLNESLEPNKSPESQMAAHQVGKKKSVIEKSLKTLSMVYFMTGLLKWLYTDVNTLLSIAVSIQI